MKKIEALQIKASRILEQNNELSYFFKNYSCEIGFDIVVKNPSFCVIYSFYCGDDVETACKDIFYAIKLEKTANRAIFIKN